MERSVLAEWANITDRFDVNVIGIATTDQHVAFITGSDHCHPDRIFDFTVAEVGRAETRTTDRTCGNYPTKKFAAVHVVVTADGGIVVVLSNFALFAGEFIDHRSNLFLIPARDVQNEG